MAASYDYRIYDASGNAITMLDDFIAGQHQRAVESSKDLLERLKGAGVTQAQIGDVLGIAQANAATFYTPGKNGKLRTLKWDEGARLIERFGDKIGESTPPPLLDVQLARLFVLHAAKALGAPISTSDERVQGLAQDLQGFVEFGLSAEAQESVEAAQAFFLGRLPDHERSAPGAA
jgi:hypothetical protein